MYRMLFRAAYTTYYPAPDELMSLSNDMQMETLLTWLSPGMSVKVEGN